MEITFLPPVLAVLFFLALVLFVISLLIGRNDIADVAWGPGIALVSCLAVLFAQVDHSWPHYLIISLTTVWALRLGYRIYLKNRHKSEDPRYAAWRESWGRWFYVRSFFQIYLLQCSLMLLLASSATVAAQYPAMEFNFAYLLLGTLIWLIGFVFEVVGDYQLDRFIKNPLNKGQLMTTGLWHYSRHPNYFGEITMWWGLWLMTVSLPLAATVWALISPITITILIVFVSGIPMLEAHMSKHPDWALYKRNTSALIPWPSRG